MTSLLRIDASAQLEDRSLTRRMTTLFIDEYRRHVPSAVIVDRDVGHLPVPPIDHRFIHAAFTPPEKREAWMTERLALSDQLIDEVIEADILVMGVPMYNYGIPSTLKAWIDHIARIGRTFSFDLSRGDKPITPILSGKRLVVLSSRGEFGFEPGGMRAHMNALDPAIAACAHYFGVSSDEMETVAIEYQEFKDERHRLSVGRAEEQVPEIARRLATTGKPA